MDVVVTAIAVVAALAIKFIFFLVYTKSSTAKAPKKAEPFRVVQKGLEPQDRRLTQKVLVIGGCGFLGSAIVRQLQERLKDRVCIIVLDKYVDERYGVLLPSVTYYEGDVCSYSHVRSAAGDCNCIIHTGAAMPDSLTDDRILQRAIEQGTRNVVEACLEVDGVRSLLFTSSATVLFSTSPPPAADSRAAPQPLLEVSKPAAQQDLSSDNARAMARAERLVLHANSHVIHVIALRLGYLYGNDDQGITADVLEGMPYAGRKDAIVPFVWVEDAARGHVDAAEQLLFPPPEKRVHGRAYHICHDPVRDPFLLGEFMGGPVSATATALKDHAVRAAEVQAGVEDPPKGTNAYGRPCTRNLPTGLAAVVARVNSWMGPTFGVALMSRHLTPENLRYTLRSWPCDVTDARQLLGWEPTPWRVVAAGLEARRFGALLRDAAADGKLKTS